MFKRVAREELKVPAEVDYLGDLRDFVTKVGRKFGVSESIINAFKLAIDEAGTNIIRHAYRDWQGFITLRMIVREQTVTISLIDQGHAFDPRNAKDPDLQRYVDIGKKGGLGVFIIRRVIDDIDYRKTEEGNELRLTKDRDSSKRHKLMVPEIPFNMKTKFFITATAVLSPLIIAAFLYQFLGVQGRITRGELEEGWGIARVAAHRSADYLLDEAHWELATISKEFHDNYAPRVWDAVIVNTAGIIQGEHQLERLFKPFVVPANAEPVEAGVKTYALTDGRRVYDLIAEIDGPQVGQVVGAVHILLDRTVIDAAIGEAKSKLIVTYIMVLIFGNLGAGLLIYLTMSPFRKLASWVKDMGQGGSPDEMDFDAGDEVGEIAKAFNEITEKFRKSQENLAEQERLQKEMQVAQEIQQTLLPDKFPDIEGYELASYYEAAKEVGGDYFDFVEVDKDTLGIVVADVSGKGVPGSLVMTMIRTALRTEANSALNEGNVRGAIEAWELALSRDPEDQQIKGNLEQGRTRLESLITELIAQARRLIRQEAISEAYKKLERAKGQALGNQQLEQRVDNEIRVLDREVDFLHNYQEGEKRFEAKDYEGAIPYLQRALTYKPNHESVTEMLQISRTMLAGGQQRMRDDVHQKYLQGIQLYRNKNYQEALEVWQEALELDPTDTRVIRAIRGVRRKLKDIKEK